MPVYLPTGDEATYNGEGGLRVEPRLILDYKHDVGFAIAANVGYLIREKKEVLNIVSDDVVEGREKLFPMPTSKSA